MDTDDILNDAHLLARELSAGSRFKIPINPFHIEAQRLTPTPNEDDDDDDWDVEHQLMPKPEPKPKKSDDGEFDELESAWATLNLERTNPRKRSP